MVPVLDPALPRERRGRLELSRPDGAIRVGVRMRRKIHRTERQRRLAARIAEPGGSILTAVPSRIHERRPVSTTRLVAVGIVGEDIPGVVQDDVEDDADPMIVRRLHERAQIVARAEARIDVEKILDAVAVIRRRATRAA